MEPIFSSNNSDLSEINKTNKNLLLKFVIIFLLVFLIIFCLYFFLFTAPNSFPKNKIINIKEGESLRSLSKDLKDGHIIRSRPVFESFVILFGGEKNIAPGDYLFESSLPAYEIARRFSEKDRRLAPIKVTIPEGYDIREIGELFSNKLKNFNVNKFEILTNDLEGYLFPDTYFFFTTDNEEDVVKYMRENFDKKIKIVTQDIEISDRTEKEIIIMASIIEREAKGDNDRALISGILWNRIRSNMPLGVDAYPSTYKIKGLPKSPICNPGLEAIRAAIHPTKSSYFYYLHDKNGGIHYAKNFTEHKKNIAKYLK